MSVVAVMRAQVSNFDEWKSSFDADPSIREKHGMAEVFVARDVADENVAMIVATFESADAVGEMLADPVVQARMAEGGVTGPPTIWIGNIKADGR